MPRHRQAPDVPMTTSPSTRQRPAVPDYTVIIPARMASTRLPDKPLADIAGKPMIVRVAEQAARSQARRVIVATDSAAVLEAVEAAGHRAIMTRTDHPSGTDRLAEAAARLGLDADHIVVNLQGDEPELPPDLLDVVAARLADADTAVMATVAHAIETVEEWLNPNVVKVVAAGPHDAPHALYFSRAPIPFARDAMKGFPQVLPTALPSAHDGLTPLRHVGLYAYRAGFLARYSRLPPTRLEQTEALEQLRVLAHGHVIALTIAAAAPPAGIDTPGDLAAVRARWAARPPD